LFKATLYMRTNIVGLNEGVTVGILVGFKEVGDTDVGGAVIGCCDGSGVLDGFDGCDVVGC
jgi:hypothetical protein